MQPLYCVTELSLVTVADEIKMRGSWTLMVYFFIDGSGCAPFLG